MDIGVDIGKKHERRGVVDIPRSHFGVPLLVLGRGAKRAKPNAQDRGFSMSLASASSGICLKRGF